MVAVANLNSEAVSFDFQKTEFESLDSEVGNQKIATEKRNLNFAAESFDMTVVVAYMNFGSDSAIEVFYNLVEVLSILYHYHGSGLQNFRENYLWKSLSFDHSFAKKSPPGSLVFSCVLLF